MASISRLKPGQTVYDVHRHRMGNTTMTELGVWPVHIMEVDPEGKWVLASWNWNPARKYGRREVARWRVNEPETKRRITGQTYEP